MKSFVVMITRPKRSRWGSTRVKIVFGVSESKLREVQSKKRGPPLDIYTTRIYLSKLPPEMRILLESWEQLNEQQQAALQGLVEFFMTKAIQATPPDVLLRD